MDESQYAKALFPKFLKQRTKQIVEDAIAKHRHDQGLFDGLASYECERLAEDMEAEMYSINAEMNGELTKMFFRSFVRKAILSIGIT